MKYLYRFLSFESLVDIVQSQSLIFMLPSLWEDPYEFAAFDCFVNRAIAEKTIENRSEVYALNAIKFRTFALCWTRIKESDALWRIYGWKNFCIRIRVKTENIKLLGASVN